MVYLRRRVVLSGAAALTATALAHPNIARAADRKVLEVWWNQGFYAAEDKALRGLVANWEKESGIKVHLSLFPNMPLGEKIISALTTGKVPDVVYANDGLQIVPQAAWNDQLADVSDVVATQQHEFSKTALNSVQLYNGKAHKRTFYAVPLNAFALNIPTWKSMVEKAGYQMSDIPNRWDEFFSFFEPVQNKLRAKGMRHVYGLGYTLSTVENDGNGQFNQFLVAYGGADIVTPDGQPHLDDPTVRRAVATTLEKMTTPYKDGYIPPGAINWNDVDNNNAFHAKEVVMTPNGGIAISTAVINNKQLYYHDIATLPLPLGNDGKPVPVLLYVIPIFVPKEAKNIDGAKDFLRYLIEPDHVDLYLKQSLGRWLPVMKSIVEKDPYWLDPSDPHRSVAVKQGVLGPTIVPRYVFNPAIAQADQLEVWGAAEADVIHGMKPEDAADKLLKRVATIFTKYPIA